MIRGSRSRKSHQWDIAATGEKSCPLPRFQHQRLQIVVTVVSVGAADEEVNCSGGCPSPPPTTITLTPHSPTGNGAVGVLVTATQVVDNNEGQSDPRHTASRHANHSRPSAGSLCVRWCGAKNMSGVALQRCAGRARAHGQRAGGAHEWVAIHCPLLREKGAGAGESQASTRDESSLTS
jgi:hypothetical protein